MKNFKNKKIKNKIISGIIAVVCIVGIGFVIYSKEESRPTVYDNSPLQQKRILVGSTTYMVSVADTAARREQGLSGTKPLEAYT